MWSVEVTSGISVVGLVEGVSVVRVSDGVVSVIISGGLPPLSDSPPPPQALITNVVIKGTAILSTWDMLISF
jgi:hypothetical protein